jgi:hypothetical protein
VIVFNLWLANVQAAQTLWEANIVIAMRLMRLASGGALAQREAQRMILEKVFAAARTEQRMFCSHEYRSAFASNTEARCYLVRLVLRPVVDCHQVRQYELLAVSCNLPQVTLRVFL